MVRSKVDVKVYKINGKNLIRTVTTIESIIPIAYYNAVIQEEESKI